MHTSFKKSFGALGNSQVIIILVLAVGGVFALILGNTIGVGEYQNAYLMLLLFGGLFLMFKLQASFWLFIPFAMVSDLPTIPLGRASLGLGQLWILGSIVCALFYWPMHGKNLKLNINRLWPIYLYTLVAFITYMRHPVGLSSFGAGTGGMRHYVTIGLGFLGMLIISNYRVNERLAKKIALLLIIGVSVEFAWKMAQFYLPALSFLTGRSAGGEDTGFYGSSQLFAIVPVIVLPLIFGRYRLGQLLTPQRVWLILVILACYVALVLSGKRSLTLVALAFPAIAELLRGKLATSVLLTGLATVTVGLMLFLNSTGVELPRTAQRVLSVFPGDWDADVEASAANSFRTTLNRIARDRIDENIWWGRGLETDYDLLYMLSENPGSVLQPGEHIAGALHASNSNWHNTWLGITVDFGLPATVFWCLTWIVMLALGWRLKNQVFRRYGDSNWLSALVLGILLWTILDVVRSWQFGHSAHNLWTITWRLGILVAIDNFMAHEQTEEEPAAAAEPGGRILRPSTAG